MENSLKNIMVNGQQETLLFKDSCIIIEEAQESVYLSVDF